MFPQLALCACLPLLPYDTMVLVRPVALRGALQPLQCLLVLPTVGEPSPKPGNNDALGRSFPRSGPSLRIARLLSHLAGHPCASLYIIGQVPNPRQAARVERVSMGLKDLRRGEE